MVASEGHENVGGVGRSRDVLATVVRQPLTWITTAWVVANLAWLQANRASRTFELDEAGYVTIAVRMARQESVRGFGATLKEGVHGPLQGVLALPGLWLTSSDPAVLLVENVLFGAVTGLLAYVAARRMGGPRPALVVAMLVLASPGVITLSHFALTAMPAVLFATLAMAALVLGRGLEQGRWAIVAGAAVGAMTLSRSMTVGFLPAFGVLALGWAFSLRTPLAIVVRNGAAAAIAALVTAAWWWLIRWDAVSAYLFGGGSADVVPFESPVDKARLHAEELLFSNLGRTTVVVAGVVLGVIALRRRLAMERRPPSPQMARPLATWPLWAATATGIVLLSTSSTLGIAFVLPMLPWVVVASVVGVARLVDEVELRVWSVLVIAAAAATSLSTSRPGLQADIYCAGEPRQRSMCAVGSNAVGGEWREAVDAVANRLGAIQATAPDDVYDVAIVSRDFLVNLNTLSLATEIQRSERIFWNGAFDPALPPDEQVAHALEADIIVTTPDYDEPSILGTTEPPPEQLEAAARAEGFEDCGAVPLPDGRTVTILVAPWVGREGCA